MAQIRKNEACTVAVIPARGGSKGLPGKNIRPLKGKPLIAFSILAAKRSGVIDHVIVTTDSSKIAEVARKYGADVPFLRPKQLARSSTPGIDPILHAVRWLELNERLNIQVVVVLQPTSPLRTAADIRGVIMMLKKKRAPAVVSVAAVREHPYWMKRIVRGCVRNFVRGKIPATRQRLPEIYILNGAIYAIDRASLKRYRTLEPPGTMGFIMPAERSVDIDTLQDFEVCKALMREKNNV